MKFSKQVYKKANSRGVRREAQTEVEQHNAILVKLTTDFMERLVDPSVKERNSYRRTYRHFNATWMREARHFNKNSKHRDAQLNSFDDWIWRMLVKLKLNKKRMNAKDKVFLSALKKSVGRWWRLKMWWKVFSK